MRGETRSKREEASKVRCKIALPLGWLVLMGILGGSVTAQPLNRPIVGAVFFYWYEWDEKAEWGNWLGGVHNTPLFGYYDSRTLQDNFRSLLLAADWGVTHFFLDYWGHGWRGENDEPRETTVLRAAEKVRALGYPIFIGYYQDGTNFAMRDFWRNISERRDTYYWLRDYARSSVWTWLFGEPFQLVYSRNGMPELTVDHESFQAWLRQCYGSLERLNSEWGTHFNTFSEITMDFNVAGFQRAMSIAYQFKRWQQDWAKLEQLVREELGLPGLRVSFDVGYAPFRNFGFERFAHTFGGPHSYAGIFGQPHEQDAERFLQTAVARKCGTVFFDHLKHRYFDWNIRVPGTAYPPDPYHFERFWIGNLMRFPDAMLHLSWNEWWEGSNLEPSMEGGKRFCEANLLFSTLWQLTYRDMKHKGRNAAIGLLVNDWIFEHGGGDASDLYNAVQGMRAVNASFDIVTQSEADLKTLKRFRVIVAPAGGVGFGFNAKGERVERVLQDWLKLGGRLLITSQGGAPNVGRSANQISAVRHPAPITRRPPFNFFVDIGVEGDETVLVRGFSGREDWGKLPEGAFGAGSKATVRWTPSEGNATVFVLPTLPNADLLLRWQGSALWRNRLRLFVNERLIGEVGIEPGWQVYEVRLPAGAVGTVQVMEVRFEFTELHIPGEKEPQRFKGERRVCNLALDWVQVCTPDIPVGERKSFQWEPTGTAKFVKPLSGSFRTPLRCRRISLSDGRVLSTYADGIPRDLLLTTQSSHIPHPSSCLFINGLFTDDPRWWATVLERIGKVSCGKFAQPASGDLPDRPALMSAVLTAGTTKFLLVENRSGQPFRLRLSVPIEPQLPIAEILALFHDGKRFATVTTSKIPLVSVVRFCAAYQIVFAPVQLTMPKWVAFPGQRTQLPITVLNLTDKPITLKLQLDSIVASIKGQLVKVSLRPKERRQIALPVEVKPFTDWGVKTVFLSGVWDTGQRVEKMAFWLRPLTVGRNAQVRCLTTAVTSHTPVLTLANIPTTPYGDVAWWHPAKEVPGETARDVQVIVTDFPSAGKSLSLKIGDLKDGERKRVHLPLPFAPLPVTNRHSLLIRWRDSAGTHEQTMPLSVTLLPEKLPASQPSQIASVVVPDADAVQGVPLSADLPRVLKGDAFVVRLPDGTPLPTHVAGGSVHFLIVPSSGRLDLGHHRPLLLPLCRTHPDDIPSPLRVEWGEGVVRVDNGALELEWREDAGGTLTKLISKRTGRDYAAQSCGVGVGTFGRFDPSHPAVTTDRFIEDEFIWQRDGRAEVRLIERNPVWATVEVVATDRHPNGFRAVQRYRVFAGIPLMELTVVAEPLPALAPHFEELVALEGRFQARWWTKSFPNFVGLGDKPPEVYGQHIVHFGWRMGDWVPPVLCLFNPDDLTETLSLLVMDNDGANLVRQGFWGGKRGKPAAGRHLATIEIAAKPPRPVRLRLWLWLHEGHHRQARLMRNRLLHPEDAVIVD